MNNRILLYQRSGDFNLPKSITGALPVREKGGVEEEGESLREGEGREREKERERERERREKGSESLRKGEKRQCK